MRKGLGLAIVGCAIALQGGALCTIAFGFASRFASHARENQLIPVPYTLAKQQDVTNRTQLRATASATTSVLVNPSINRNSALDFNLVGIKSQTLDSAISVSDSSEQMPWWERNPQLTNLALQVSPYPIAAFLHQGGIQTPKFSDPSIPSPDDKSLSTDQLYAQILSQDIPKTKDGERFRGVMQYAIAQKLHQRPFGDIIQAIANQFLGAAYKANLLDQSKEETLVVNLNQFDCVLFVETVLAIARGVAVQDYSYATFINHLRDQRYWDGQIDGYCSRLHYFSQWIHDNQKRGNVQNIGQNLGGLQLNKTLNFMSTHRQSYPRMANDDTTYHCIVEREAQLDGFAIEYIPTKQIRRAYPKLQPGDIIAVATSIPGLDVTHTGLVYRQPNGNIGFIHASPAGQVTIARDLQRYASRVDQAIGILVVRPLDPRQTTTNDQASPNF